ncbi:hypothetical protein FB567DRAFT_578540 [Paraphoma chrysanthemicola]|uniref:Uncharacterized protein n=1 Tax=Paraphoma chrysanthemicola TaxID=798071 RepID=A0A8K0W0G8_9PLEO|nr:hypothetical protein FB567DRAFT_578540 [Paraphoma chrysanthemicola]
MLQITSQTSARTALARLKKDLITQGLKDTLSALPQLSWMRIECQSCCVSEYPYRVIVGTKKSRNGSTIWAVLRGNPIPLTPSSKAPQLDFALGDASPNMLGPGSFYQFDSVALVEPFKSYWANTAGSISADTPTKSGSWDTRRGGFKGLVYWYLLNHAAERNVTFRVPKTIPGYLKQALLALSRPMITIAPRGTERVMQEDEDEADGSDYFESEEVETETDDEGAGTRAQIATLEEKLRRLKQRTRAELFNSSMLVRNSRTTRLETIRPERTHRHRQRRLVRAAPRQKRGRPLIESDGEYDGDSDVVEQRRTIHSRTWTQRQRPRVQATSPEPRSNTTVLDPPHLPVPSSIDEDSDRDRSTTGEQLLQRFKRPTSRVATGHTRPQRDNAVAALGATSPAIRNKPSATSPNHLTPIPAALAIHPPSNPPTHQNHQFTPSDLLSGMKTALHKSEKLDLKLTSIEQQERHLMAQLAEIEKQKKEADDERRKNWVVMGYIAEGMKRKGEGR